MKLGEKLRYLRLVEGTLRGLDREMTQQDLAKAMKKEIGRGLSQSYLSQIENGQRPHLTNETRLLLAKFFKVHPGYLVDDPDGFHTELLSEVGGLEDRLDLWLIDGAQGQFWPVWVAIIVLLPLIRNAWRLYGPAPQLDRVERELEQRARRGGRRGRRRGGGY